MSYIRASGPYTYVDEDECVDYVYCSVGGKDYPEYIEDYGSITDNGMIELLCENWIVDKDEEIFKTHLIKRLAERLGVKLRNPPLTSKKWAKIFEKQMEDFKRK